MGHIGHKAGAGTFCFIQCVRHIVKGNAQIRQLIAASHLDSVREVADGKLLGGSAHLLQRGHHLFGQVPNADEGQHQTGQRAEQENADYRQCQGLHAGLGLRKGVADHIAVANDGGAYNIIGLTAYGNTPGYGAGLVHPLQQCGTDGIAVVQGAGGKLPKIRGGIGPLLTQNNITLHITDKYICVDRVGNNIQGFAHQLFFHAVATVNVLHDQ